MQTDPKTIKKHFKKSIEKYDDNAIAQKITAERLVSGIEYRNFDKILEIGTGTGFLTKLLAQKYSFSKYTANDLVEDSENFVKKYIPNAEFIEGDFREIKFKEKFNLIASNAVFQWFENLDNIFDKCTKLLCQEGILAFSTFSPDNFKEFKKISGLSLKYKSLDELEILLNKSFEVIKIEKFEYKMKFNNAFEILTHMKNTGVNSLSKNKWHIKDIKSFCNTYTKNFPELNLTYSPIIVIAKLK